MKMASLLNWVKTKKRQRLPFSIETRMFELIMHISLSKSAEMLTSVLKFIPIRVQNPSYSE